MSFTIKRPNASIWDLPAEKQEEMQSIFDMALMTRPRLSQLDRAALIQFYQEFGVDRVIKCIERWAMLGFNSMDSLHGLLCGKIPMERKGTAIDEMPGRDRPRKLGEPLRIDAVLEAPPRKPMTLPPYVMSESDAVKWLTDTRKVHPNFILDYFDTFGRDNQGRTFYQLKPEYR